MGPNDGETVREILAKMREEPRAVDDGRVFRGRVRITSGDEPVRPGETIRVAKEKTSRADDIVILAQGRGYVAVLKPAGMPTIADHGGRRGSLHDAVAERLVMPLMRVHATSRLDRDVSGVVVFAIDPRSLKAFAEARERGTYSRRYVALASSSSDETVPEPPFGVWSAPIGRAKDPRHREAFGRDSTPAETRFRVVASVPGAHLLALGPVTGRTHQIRVHASHAGLPLLGDKVYGGPSRLTLPGGRILPLGRVYLHAARIAIEASPFDVTAEAEIPNELLRAWESLGGTPDPWKIALSCALDGSS